MSSRLPRKSEEAFTNTSPSTVYRWIKEHEDNQKEQKA